ncbi:MAG: hypothetical protein KatS3mg119_1507 [Rhodothalassiaceae bacterium]|nr:MAG: hypothetical protein KatS3mg119_1507 [Rhodothalassiaceae bacterium]
MTSLARQHDARAARVSTTEDELVVDLVDGRRLSVPLAWFPRLLHATPDQRARYELLGDGEGIHWPDVDEDVSVAGLLEGLPSLEAGAARPRRARTGSTRAMGSRRCRS